MHTAEADDARRRAVPRQPRAACSYVERTGEVGGNVARSRAAQRKLKLAQGTARRMEEADVASMRAVPRQLHQAARRSVSRMAVADVARRRAV